MSERPTHVRRTVSFYSHCTLRHASYVIYKELQEPSLVLLVVKMPQLYARLSPVPLK